MNVLNLANGSSSPVTSCSVEHARHLGMRRLVLQRWTETQSQTFSLHSNMHPKLLKTNAVWPFTEMSILTYIKKGHIILP